MVLKPIKNKKKSNLVLLFYIVLVSVVFAFFAVKMTDIIKNPKAPSSKTEAQTQDIKCKVVAVLDGDTLDCLEENKTKIRVRLQQIDAPEKKQAFGQASKQALSSLIYRQQVTVKATNQDKYGRYLGEVYLGEKNVNKLMVYNGYAWAYKEYVTDKEYLHLQELAQQKKMGLWKQPNPIYPSEFRHGADK